MNLYKTHTQEKEPMLISIVTCTYNSAEHLLKALRSVETQRYEHIEHIINDSYSTDETLSIIAEYIQRNENRYPIRFVQTEPKGVANALNEGTKYASGDVIHYLHSDDYYLDSYALTRVAGYFEQNPELMWVTGNFMVEIRGNKMVIPHSHLLKLNPYATINSMNLIHHENTFVRREAVLKYGGFCEDKSQNVEYRIWLRMIRDHQPLVVNDEFTVFIIHKGSTSTGNLWQFSKAIGRAFNTQNAEKVVPLLGYYGDSQFLENSENMYRNIRNRVTSFIDSII